MFVHRERTLALLCATTYDTGDGPKKLSPSAILLWMTIATFTEGRRNGWWSVKQEDLAAVLGWTDRNIRDHLGPLRAAGLVEVRAVYFRRKDGLSRRSASRYRVNLPDAPMIGRILPVSDRKDPSGNTIGRILPVVRSEGSFRSSEDDRKTIGRPPPPSGGGPNEDTLTGWAASWLTSEAERAVSSPSGPSMTPSEASDAWRTLTDEDRAARLSEAHEEVRGWGVPFSADEEEAQARDLALVTLAEEHEGEGSADRARATVYRAAVDRVPALISAALADAFSRGLVASTRGTGRVQVAAALATAGMALLAQAGGIVAAAAK